MSEPSQSDGLISLGRALRERRIPEGNHALIQQMMSHIGIVGCDPKVKSYVKAIRADGLHPIHIHSGYSEFFSSREEALAASGGVYGVSDWTVDGGPVNWGVKHPFNNIRF